MAWMATAAAVTAMALAVAPGARNSDGDGTRAKAEGSGPAHLYVTPAPWASLNGEGEGTAQLEVVERTASDATAGDLARFRAEIRLGDHRLELFLEEAGATPESSGEPSEEGVATSRRAAGGVTLDGYWTGPAMQGDQWGTRAADVVAWGRARVTLDGRELTDAARLELAAFAASDEPGEARGGQLHVIVRDVPELSVIRMRFPEGVRLELERSDQRAGDAVAARPGETDSDGPEVLRDGDALIPDEGPIPQDELERHVVMGTVPGPMVIEIEVQDTPAAEEAGTGGSGEAVPADEGAAAEEVPEAQTGGAAGAADAAPTQPRAGQERAMQQDARAPRTQQQGAALAGREVTPDADVQLPEGAGGSGTPGLPAARFPAAAGDGGWDGRIEGIAPSNTQTGTDRVEVLQDAAPTVDRGTDAVSGIAPLNTAPVEPESRVLSPGVTPLTSEIPVSSTGLPPGSETNDGVLESTVRFGPGAGGATRFGPGVGGGPTAAELEAQRTQEQAQGTVRPLGTLEDVPEMPAPIPPMNTSPAAPLPQGIQPLNAQPASPAR